MLGKIRKVVFKLLNAKNGLLADGLILAGLFVLNLIYLWPFLGEADKSNGFSGPLIPLISQLLSWLTGLELSKTITLSLLVLVALGPSVFYLFAFKLTKRRLAGLSAALVYSLPIEWFAKGRIRLAFLVGDGAHIAALSLVSGVVLFLWKFLQRGQFRYLMMAGVMMALVALCSPFSLLTGVMILTVVVFSELLQGDGRLKILRFLVFLVFSVGLVAFWYNPSFVKLFIGTSQGAMMKKTLLNLVPLTFVVLPIAGAFGFLLFEKRAHLQSLFVALGLVVLFSLVSFASQAGKLFPSHPRRYVPELGLSLSLLSGVMAMSFSDYLRFKGQFHKVKLTPLGRAMARRVFWLASMGLMGGVIIFSLDSVKGLMGGQVMGIESSNLTGALEVRAAVRGIDWLGYLITSLTITAAFLVWFKVREGRLISKRGKEG